MRNSKLELFSVTWESLLVNRLIASRHCGVEYETKYSASIETHTATSIHSANQKSIDSHKEESIDSSPDDWENDYYNPTMAMHTAIPTRDTLHTEEYDEDYEEEQAIEYRAILAEEDRLLHHSSWKRNAMSIERTVPTSIDTLETTISQQHADELHEGFTTKELLNMRERDEVDQHRAEACGEGTRFSRPLTRATRPSIDIGGPTSIDRLPEFGKRAYDRDGTRRFHWEEKDEYGVYKDDYGHARDVDGHLICVSKDDIRSLLERASMDEHRYLCLLKQARSFTQTKLVPEIYTKDEINEMFYGVCGAQENNECDFQMKLDGVYYPLNDSISWLTTCMEEMRQDIARIQTHRAAEATAPASIDRHLSTSIDDDLTHSNMMKSQPDSYTRAEIDQLVEEIYRTLETAERGLIGDREIVEIQRYIACRPEASTTIDRRNNISTDSRRWTSIVGATNRGSLVPKITSVMSDTNNHGEEISDDAYTTFIRNQFQLESLEERLQKIENADATMKDKGRRGDEAIRDFTAYDRDGTRRFHWEEKDEYGVYRDDQRHARDVDGHIIRVSKDDIRSLLEHASSFTQTKVVPEIYTKDDINEMFYGVYGAQEKNEGDFQMKLDGVYYPLNDSISWLTTCIEEMTQDIAKIQTHRATEEIAPASIDRHQSTLIDDNPPHSNPMKSQPDSYTKAEIDQLVEEIYRTLESAEERLDRRGDDIYFPMDLAMSSLTSQIEAIQREIVKFQRYIARRP
ncbi:hypothetical protein DY000_02031426 [Brassica cretica]|uniref:Uncharacterized protein n=1 Tax=Brassica cretica TaxID=69181 RepID=A0ABQ7DFG3_BRACR|nr:hypothetical protein DY000_02031426 [Brassica cretica]